MNVMKNPVKAFEKLCSPAKVYLLLSFASVVVYCVHYFGKGKQMYSIQELGVQVIVMFIWTFVLNKVCTLKYGVKISWFLVFLPIIFMMIMLLFMATVVNKLDLTKEDVNQMLEKINKEKEEDDGLEGLCDSCSN